VKTIKPSGITTTLSYPTWEGVIFEWLRVEVEVLEPVKGTRKGDFVQTVMLSIQPEVPAAKQRAMYSPPGTVEPKEADTFLFCLAPTTLTNVFAAVTAPYDEDQSIFSLDRQHDQYRGYRAGKDERHDVIWSLVKESGEILSPGADQMRRTYANEIRTAPSNGVVYLQWQAKTNAAGWFRDVPKEPLSKTTRNVK
jgi:hypothetical protein